jgi:cell division protein FtsL
MLKLFSLIAVLLTFGSVFGLYALKYDARRLESEVQAKERTLEKLQADIAVLRAERAYLGRPERIEELARAQGLEPIRRQQYVDVGARPTKVGRSVHTLQ